MTETEQAKTKIIRRHVNNLLSPFERFVHSQVSTGVFLLGATVLALLVANSPLEADYRALLHWQFGIQLDGWELKMPLIEWVNSGLMSLFFFLIGLEIKREILAGELRERKKLLLVLFAAVGGMVMPAVIYLFFNNGTTAMDGWAIPMATDTAFALGAFALLGRKHFGALATFLTALAIFDDIGSILVIAFYYTDSIVMTALLKVSVLFGALVLFNVCGIRSASLYFIAGALLWYFLHESGVHAQISGILVAAAVPAHRKEMPRKFLNRMQRLMKTFEKKHKTNQILSDQKQHEIVMAIEQMAEDASTPLQRWETKSENPIGLGILPVFAFFNAGIPLHQYELTGVLTSPIMAGITLGLVLGKPLGIALFSWLAIRLGLGRMPQGTGMAGIAGVGLLAGMGFTMSFLVTTLSFPLGSVHIEEAKIAVLTATLVSGIIGLLWLRHLKAQNHAHGNHRRHEPRQQSPAKGCP